MIMITGTTAGIIITIITAHGLQLFLWALVLAILIIRTVLFGIIHGNRGTAHIIQWFIIKIQQFIIGLLTGTIFLLITTRIIITTICLCKPAAAAMHILIQTEQEPLISTRIKMLNQGLCVCLTAAAIAVA